MKTCQLHCTPVSVINAGYSILSPGLYAGISVSNKVYEDQCQLHCYPVYQSVTQDIAACHLKCTPEYQSATKKMKTWQLHCTLMYQSVTWGIHLECIDRSTLISVSDKVYEDLSATLFPGVSVSNPGYNGLSPGMFLKYWSATKYMKTCLVVCTPEYNSVYQSMMQSMEGLEFILEYLHIYKYGLKHCHLWKVKFSDDCLKNKSVC